MLCRNLIAENSIVGLAIQLILGRYGLLQTIAVLTTILSAQVIPPAYSQTIIDNSCIQVTEPKLASLQERPIDKPRLGMEFVISTAIVDSCPIKNQTFDVIIEVRNSDGVTEQIGFKSVTTNQTAALPKVDLNWVPNHVGDYEFRSFAIGGFDSLSTISRLMKTSITITNSVNEPDPSEAFTIILIPDTQNYWPAKNGKMAYNQSKWIVENKEKLNIELVIHLGDIVNTWNSKSEWDMAENMINILDHDGIPYITLAGNHDFGNPYSSKIKRNFDFFDTFPESVLISNQTLENNQITSDRPNTYTMLTVGKNEFMIVSMEYCPPLSVVKQVSEFIKQHPDIPVILATHAFLRNDASWTSVSGGGICTKIAGTDDYSTKVIWDEIVYPNANVFLVVAGHSGGDNKRIDYNIAGKPVQQVVIDYQHKKNGGDGMLKIVRFEPKEDKIYFQTYSPWLDSYLSGAKTKFTFDFQMD